MTFFIYVTKKENLFSLHIQTMIAKSVTCNAINHISISFVPTWMGKC